MLTVSSALFVEKANAHGAWLGNCVVDFSQSTKNAYQIIDSDNDGVADALGSPIGDGDFIEYQASCPVIVDGTDSGPGGWVTFYVPEGSRIANAWITDSQGNAVDARKALGGGNGISGGWGPKGELTFDVSSNGWQPENTTACDDAGYTGNNKKCNAGLAFTYGDTGIFYSTRSDTAMYTGDSSKKITLSNGYLIQPSNNKPWASVGGSGNARTHNKWDAVQSNAFGSKDPLSNNGFTTSEETYLTPDGRGSTPFNTGSPVAGPDSGVTWDRYGTTGPWQRIKYSGSCFAGDPSNAPANSAGAVEGQGEVGVNSVEVCSETSAGFDLASGGDASFLPSATNAVRFAFGGLAENETYYFKVRLKVNDAENLGYANFESSGGDSAEGIKGGNDNPWRYWVGAVGSIDPTVAIIDEIQKTNTGDGLSVRFDSQSCGFVGKFGTNAQKLLDLTQLSTLGITRSSFSQNLGDRSSSFQLQGNDIPGTLSLFYESGGAEQSLKFNGAIVWQDKANGKTFGFGFVPAVGVDVTLSGYNIVGIAANNGKRTNSSNFFLCANGQEANFPTVGAGDDYSGSADPPLTELNAYLNSSESQQAPTIVTSVSDSTKAEATDLVHTVTLSGSPAADVTFAYDLTDVSATGDSDYTVAPTFSAGVTLSGTTLTIPAGVSSFTITYPGLGDTVDEVDETYTVTVGGQSGTGTITDDDEITVASVGAATQVEGTDLAHTVTLSGAPASAVTFAYAAADVTATGGSDYTTAPTFSDGVTLASGTLTIPAGVSSFTITYPGLTDTTDEVDETYTVTVGGQSGTGTITDDDVITIASVGAATEVEATALVHTVMLSGAPASAVTFSYGLADVTAAGSSDYTVTPTFSAGVTLTDTTLTIPAGVTSFTITYPGLGDTVDEVDETYTVTVGGQSGTGTITDDDVITIASVGAATEVEATALVHTVTLSGAPASAVTFSYGLADVTAAGSSDYTVTPTFSAGVTLTDTTLTIPAGVTSFTITYPGLGDTVDEVDETYTVTVGGQSGTGTITDDFNRNPALTLIKTASDPVDNDSNGVDVGDVITYTYVATNSGNVTLTNVGVAETQADFTGTGTLPSPAYASGGSDQDSDSATDDLAVDESVTWTATYALTQADVNAGFVENQAKATGSSPGKAADVEDLSDDDGTNDSDKTKKTYSPVSNQTLAKAVTSKTGTAGAYAVGDVVTYTITQTNTGNVTLNNVVITDAKLTASTTTGKTGSCASVAPSATCVLEGTYTITQTEKDAGTFKNTASVKSTEIPTALETSNTITLASNAKPTLSKALTSNADEDKTSTITVGDTLTYTVTLLNDGDVTLTDTTITDDKISPSSASCSSVAVNGTCILTGTYKVTQADVDAGKVVNNAASTSKNPAGTTLTRQASNEEAITQSSAQTLAKVSQQQDGYGGCLCGG